ncbi:MAG: hypothetical protein ACO1Q7_13755 [Gemmatimonas sp.]
MRTSPPWNSEALYHLNKKKNRQDLQTGMKQYFDHDLKGAPMPQWVAEGLPQTRKGAPIK